MDATQPFEPSYDNGQLVSVTSTAQTIGVDPMASCLRIIVVGGTTNVFARVTSNQVTGSAVDAVANKDFMLLPNLPAVISKGNNTGQLSLVTASGTASVYVQPGYGLWGN